MRPHPFQICHQCATPEELRVKIHNQQSGQGACKICGKVETTTRTGNPDQKPQPMKSRIKHWIDIATVATVALIALLFFAFVFVMAIYGCYKALKG